MTLTTQDLLAGAGLQHEIDVPPDLLSGDCAQLPGAKVVVRPLTVHDLQRIGKAIKDDEGLSAALMIQHALVDPVLQLEQIFQMPAGLARFLVDHINEISGISMPRDALEEFVEAPLAKACFVLAKEFGWTPEQASAMTIGQILLYLDMARKDLRT
jgi:hypothetical protein